MRGGKPEITRGSGHAPSASGSLPRGGRRRISARLKWAAALLAAAGLAAAAAAIAVSQLMAAPVATVAVASLPYWSIDSGTTVVLSHREDFTEVSPWIYGLNGSGQIIVQSPSTQAGAVADIARLRAAGLRIAPTLANNNGSDWVYQPVARMLHSKALMEQHIAAIVGLVRDNHYAGIDIDYEQLHAGDRQAFSTFITRLAAALHAHGKALSVAVFAKTGPGGSDPETEAEDYAAIGRAADQVRLMGYDYHWETSQPGPIAPIGWIRDVLSYARTEIPAGKIILGVPLYGIDWVGSQGTAITWKQAEQLASRYKVPVRYDSSSDSPWFSYTDSSGRAHQVWFESPTSSRVKFTAARDAGIGGVFLWMYGDAAPGTWPALRQVLAVAAPAPDRSPGGTP